MNEDLRKFYEFIELDKPTPLGWAGLFLTFGMQIFIFLFIVIPFNGRGLSFVFAHLCGSLIPMLVFYEWRKPLFKMNETRLNPFLGTLLCITQGPFGLLYSSKITVALAAYGSFIILILLLANALGGASLLAFIFYGIAGNLSVEKHNRSVMLRDLENEKQESISPNGNDVPEKTITTISKSKDGDSVQVIYCTQCAHPLYIDAKFCSNCAAPIKKAN